MNKVKRRRVLIVDDELSIRRFVSSCLKNSGYEVCSAVDGEEALVMAIKENPDLVMLDIMMPKLDGLEVCRRLREWTTVPIIMLSARDEETSIVECLDSGADDYVTKPFGVQELLARVRTVFRRVEAGPEILNTSVLDLGDIEISFADRKVRVNGAEVKLTPKEYDLLHELGIHAGKVLTHSHLLHKIWGPEYQTETEYVHEFIRRLRNKLEPDKKHPSYIISVSGIGYELQLPGQNLVR